MSCGGTSSRDPLHLGVRRGSPAGNPPPLQELSGPRARPDCTCGNPRALLRPVRANPNGFVLNKMGRTNLKQARQASSAPQSASRPAAQLWDRLATAAALPLVLLVV